ncbi:hypothetical protein Syun_000642 [Stephania yunnanensis]|uniref:Uncharacterized protein n=1 Tax=Stephania yunnanensis TaxID=152371 RepID=A0AAP0Q5I1_9MAGN
MEIGDLLSRNTQTRTPSSSDHHHQHRNKASPSPPPPPPHPRLSKIYSLLVFTIARPRPQMPKQRPDQARLHHRPAAAFKKMSSRLENSIGDVSRLLRIATLHKGSLDDRSDVAASLVSLAGDNDRYGKLIIEEGGVAPLLKLVKEGKMEGQENAARAIGLMGRDPESVDHMIHAGVCSVFAKVLKEGHMKFQPWWLKAVSNSPPIILNARISSPRTI